VKDINTTLLIERLAHGWTSSHAGLAQELVQRWAAPLCNEADIIRVGENTAEFVTVLSDIRLRTMHEVPCLLVGGESDLSRPLRDFWTRSNSTQHIPFVLTLSEAAHAAAVQILHSGRGLILSPEQIKKFLRSQFPLLELKQLLLRQIPRRSLVPYNLLVPAEGGMFFGRENELSRLREEDFTSFAIAGPGRIGKTSLARYYQDERLRSRHPGSSRSFYISLYNAEHLPDRIARFIAMRIQNSRRSDRMNTKDLLNFLLYQNKLCGGPLELILDEVDEDCEGEAFKVLGEAARAHLCRLILCGKGTLLKTMLSSKSPLDCRLDLVQLEPLDTDSARDLLIKPLEDLGFKVDNPDRLSEEILELTGQMPHLIQLFGMKLVDRAINDKSEVISTEYVEILKTDFFIAQFFIKPFNELSNADTKLIALALLSESQQSFTVLEVQAIALREGLKVDSIRINEICLDLLVNNILAWDNGSYRIANGGLQFYIRKNDFLKNSLEEARRARRSKPTETLAHVR
jgi:hypothetical protein